jgi:hypothetical protein
MFCSSCGKPLDDGAKFCPNCGSPVGGAASAPQTPDREVVIKEGLCNRVKSKLFVQNGHGMLTNKRFIYSKHSLAKIAAMGVFANLTKGTYEFEIPVSEISGIRDGRQGVSQTIIITTKSGDEYNFYFTDRERWKIEFGNLIQP